MTTRCGAWVMAAVLTAPVAAAAHPEEQDGKWMHVDGPRQVKAFNVGPSGTLKLGNVSGDVMVTGGSGSEIRIEATPHGKGKTDAEARAQLDTVTIEMRQSGSRVDVETKHQNKSRAWVDYIVIVPTGTTVDVRTVSGDVNVKEISGLTSAETVSGDVVAMGLGNVASLKTVSGDVSAKGLTASGPVTLQTVSGDVVAKGLKAPSVSYETVSGDAVVEACDCGGAKASTVSGDISYTGPLTKGGRYVFNTHSGDVSISTPSGFDFDGSTFSGDLRVEGLTPQGETDRRGRTARGTVGGGGAVVEVKTFSGDLRVGRPR
jgi:DUF4097 and DUF4098 domain-containing protein YvlB